MRGRLCKQDAVNHKYNMPTWLACLGPGNQQLQHKHTALKDPYVPCRGSSYVTAARSVDSIPSQHTLKVPEAVLTSSNRCPRKVSHSFLFPEHIITHLAKDSNDPKLICV